MSNEERAMLLLEKHEKKLIELMGEEAYCEWAVTVATEAFISEIDVMTPDEIRGEQDD